jgi:hypothetical protein
MRPIIAESTDIVGLATSVRKSSQIYFSLILMRPFFFFLLAPPSSLTKKKKHATLLFCTQMARKDGLFAGLTSGFVGGKSHCHTLSFQIGVVIFYVLSFSFFNLISNFAPKKIFFFSASRHRLKVDEIREEQDHFLRDLCAFLPFPWKNY